MGDAVFVCGPGDVLGGPRSGECIGCGGFVGADPMPGEERGPFVAPEGSKTAGWAYCSELCWEDWEEHLAREDERRVAQTALCPECGFDNQEHDVGCSLVTVFRTVVCRNPKCRGGGWWGAATPRRCPNCRGALTELAKTMVQVLRG